MVYNGIDPCTELLYTTKERYITFCGRLRKNKGGLTLIQAFECLQNNHQDQGYRLRIIGDGEMKETMLRYTSDHNIPNITFEGSLPNKEARRMIHEAAFHVVPSDMEGFGLSALEAMAEGTAVITSDCRCFYEYIDPGSNGLIFPKGDTEALAACMEKYIKDEKLREQIEKEGRKTAERFTWDHTARSIERICSELLGETGG